MEYKRKMSETIDAYIKEAVSRGLKYERLEQWLEDWVANTDATRTYNGVEIYEAFHLMAPSISKWTTLLNGEELYFSIDKFPLDFEAVKEQLKVELERSDYKLLLPIEKLKYHECKQLIKTIKFGRRLPLHLQGVLIKEPKTVTDIIKLFLTDKMNVNPIKLQENSDKLRKQYAEVMKTTKRVMQMAYRSSAKNIRAATQTIKIMSLNISNALLKTIRTSWKVTTKASTISFEFAKEKSIQAKDNFVEAKKNNFGINVTELKKGIVNAVFYSYIGALFLVLMLINL